MKKIIFIIFIVFTINNLAIAQENDNSKKDFWEHYRDGNRREYWGKLRINYFDRSFYRTNRGGGTGNVYYTGGGGGTANHCHALEIGKGFDIQFASAKIQNIGFSRVDGTGIGLVINTKFEKLKTENFQYENVLNSFGADIGLALYLSLFELQFGFGYTNISNPMLFEAHMGQYYLSIHNPSGCYYAYKVYFNLPIVLGFSANIGGSANYFTNKFITYDDVNYRWRNYKFNYGLVYKFPLKKRKKNNI